MRAKSFSILVLLVCFGFLMAPPSREAEAQSGCSFSLSRNSDSFPGISVQGSVVLTASDGSCGWTASGIPSWVQGFPTSGTGTTTITFSLTRNDTAVEREAAITVAGLRYRISQDGCLPPETGRYPAVITATVGTSVTVNPLVAPFDDGVLTVTSPSADGGGLQFTGTADADNGGQIRLRRLGPVGTFVVSQNVSDDCGNVGGAPIFTLNIVPEGQAISPTISGFSPLSAAAGDTLTVTGANFVAGETTVLFGDVPAVGTVISSSQLSVQVPVGAFGGPLQVLTKRGSGASAQSFSIAGAGPAPTIVSLGRTSASVGQVVTVSGTNFQPGVTQIRLSEGQVVNPQVTSSTSASFTVPSGAITGPVRVLTPGGSGKSAANLVSTFTVGQNCPRPAGSVAITVGSTAVNPGQTAVVPIDFSQVCPGQGGNTLQFDIALNATVVNLDGGFAAVAGDAVPAAIAGNLTVARHPTNPQAIRISLPNSNPAFVFGNGRFCTLQIPTLAPPSGMTFGASAVQVRNDGILTSYIDQIGVGPVRIGSTSGNGDISGTITVAPGAGCSILLGTTVANLSGTGGTGTFSLTAQNGCAWEALSNATWITFPVPATGAGSGAIQYSVAPNPGSARSGTIAIGGQAFTVNQAARGGATVGAFRPTNGFVYLRNANSTGFADNEFFYGIAEDIPVVGDWDGDGIDSVGIYRGGVFYLRNSNSTGFADFQYAFGATGDVPIAGDWDGDGVDTVGLVRGNQVFLKNANAGGVPDVAFVYGSPGDLPIAGDWNGDGIDTIGAYRPTNGFVYLRNSNSEGVADVEFFYGQASDVPVAGDWNGDGVDTVGIVRGGIWFLRNSNSTGFADIQFAYGVAGDVPIVGNWTGQ
jgi:hypothetical protein